MSLRVITLLLSSALASALLLIGSSSADALPLIKKPDSSGAQEIEALSENMVWKFSGGSELKCATVRHKTTLTQNTFFVHGHSTATAVGNPGTTPHSGPCRMGFLQVVVELLDDHTFFLLGSGGGGESVTNMDMTFRILHPLLGEIMCDILGEGSVTYVSGTDEMAVSGSFVGTENVPPCSAEGTFSGDYTVTDEEGEPVTID